VIIQVGQVIGPWWTILLLIADSIVGSWLLRREGGRAWRALRSALNEGRMPAKELADGVLIVVGGTLMISPGFVTDLFGVLLILPFTRPIGRRVLAGIISRRLVAGPGGGFQAGFGPGFGAGFGGGFGTAGPADGPGSRPGNASRPGPDVVQGDVVDPGEEPPRP
jgi:UPF0716 protein FxsA